jgi:RNA polymerase sigma factor (sigma-70 family)
MSRGTATALGEVVRAAVRGGGASLSDRDLLIRFADGGDEAAFAALFRRHSGMVLGVCRRALSNVQDAEDACQATFLLLARRANSGRWQTSVANWLYTAARRVAGNARVAAERRARREKKAAVPEVIQPVDRMTGRELLDVLDVELDRLPPGYREPLVLCYLEGLTRDEAAARLGMPPLTLKTRLERGRKRLGDALTRRGCVLGAGLLALAATSPVGASPSRLLQAALTAAAGSPPPSVEQLTRGVVTNAAGRGKLLGLLALAGACLLGVGLTTGQLNSAGAPPEKAAPTPADAPAGAKANAPKLADNRGSEVTLKGSVIGVDGKPFPGAKLLLLAKGDHPTELGVSGADGQFAVAIPKDLPDGYLVARAEGFGIGFRGLVRPDPAKAVELRLVKDNPIRGRILDTQGKPVAGVSVRVKVVADFANGSLDTFLSAWKIRHPMSGLPEGGTYLWTDLVAQVLHATSDAEGRFTIHGPGAERFVNVRVDKPGVADSEYWIINRAGFDAGPYNEASRKNITKGLEEFERVWLLHGPDLAVIAEAEKPVRGVVTAADTGKGRAGVVVRLTRGGNGQMLLPIPLSATTDANGHYEIHGARKMNAYMVEIAGDTETAYMPCQVRTADTVGYEPVVADLRLVKGVVITGRVLDRSTGKGVPGMVMAAVLQDNPYAKDYGMFDSASTFPMRDTTDDGKFRVVAIPGPVILMGGPDGRRLPAGWEVMHRYKQAVPDPNYPQYFPKKPFDGAAFMAYGGAFNLIQGNWCKVLDIKPGTTVVEQDILLVPATTLPLQLRDEAGKPVTGVSAAGVSPKDWFPTVKCQTDTCTVYDVEPGKRRLVVLYQPSGKLAASVEPKGDEKPPVVVTFRKPGAVKGRLVGPDGKPLAGVAVGLQYKDRAAEEINNIAYAARQIVTGPDGTFVADTILPGLPFELSFKRNTKDLKPTQKPPAALQVEAGQTMDRGDIAVKEAEDTDQ